MRLFPFYHHPPSSTNTTETMSRSTKNLRPRIQVSSDPAPEIVVVAVVAVMAIVEVASVVVVSVVVMMVEVLVAVMVVVLALVLMIRW